ncbi:hypothetical protein J6590_003298 [Homalodisca vitripennis]|nr:hypothetical protein J6590_003298 [Homalodisca vitripennis]
MPTHECPRGPDYGYPRKRRRTRCTPCTVAISYVKKHYSADCRIQYFSVKEQSRSHISPQMEKVDFFFCNVQRNSISIEYQVPRDTSASGGKNVTLRTD